MIRSLVTTPTASAAASLRSSYTLSFPELLAEINASLMVSTYQAGKLVLLRNEQGALHLHGRNFGKPMGMALSQDRLAIGCTADIREFRNIRENHANDVAAADSNSHSAPHDACYLPWQTSTTGDIQIHEMDWVQTPDAGQELIFVNTAFSCLARRSDVYSFEPVWQPQFIDRLAPGDRCHLNGMALRDGRVRYVTALGETNAPGAWRENKRSGGVIIDVDSRETICRGLSMPHSPRWHKGQLWLLESGNGTIGRVDLNSGKYESIAQFPGFTRGLALHGPWAFIGLSQVRQSNTFNDLPLLDRRQGVEDRICGVWALNLETGKPLGFCNFEEGMQEIFSVAVLPGVRSPEVVNHDLETIKKTYFLPPVGHGTCA